MFPLTYIALHNLMLVKYVGHSFSFRGYRSMDVEIGLSLSLSLWRNGMNILLTLQNKVLRKLFRC